MAVNIGFKQANLLIFENIGMDNSKMSSQILLKYLDL
jgi:hypothetical protein